MIDYSITEPSIQEATIRPFWRGSDRNISKMIPGESWSKLGPMRIGDWTKTYPRCSLMKAGLNHDPYRPFLRGIGLKHIQLNDSWCMLDYLMTQPDVQETTIRPFDYSFEFTPPLHHWLKFLWGGLHVDILCREFRCKLQMSAHLHAKKVLGDV